MIMGLSSHQMAPNTLGNSLRSRSMERAKCTISVVLFLMANLSAVENKGKVPSNIKMGISFRGPI